MKSAFVKDPVLVIDRAGLIGELLCLKLSSDIPIVFVSGRNSNLNSDRKNIAYVSFMGSYPKIPDNRYSHIIFVDEDGEDLELLPKIIDKTRSVNSEFIFAQGLLSKGDYATNKIFQLLPSAKVVIFGDVFDSTLILRGQHFKSTVNKFIYQAQKFGKMQVMGDGMREAYPVFLPDIADCLSKIVSGFRKTQSLFYIFPKFPVSELSLAHMIQKMNPEITIDFVRHDPRSDNISFPSSGEYMLEDKYPIAKKIRGVDIKRTIEVKNRNPHKSSGRVKRLSIFIVWTLAFLLLSPLIFTIFFSQIGLNTLYYAKAEMDRGNFVGAKSSLRLSRFLFSLGKRTTETLLFQARFVGGEGSTNIPIRDIEVGYKMSDGFLQLFDAGIYFANILSGTSKDPVGDFTKAQSYLKNSVVILDRIKAEGKIPAPILQNLETINPLVKLLTSTVDVMPDILGMEGERAYLILFQNNLELRPGGGFIGSYGIAKLNKGKITEFSVHDVYDADEKLRGHVEPPFAIRRYLSQKHWYLRDSNFSLDFPESAKAASDFMLAEIEQKINGVIAVDVSFVRNILHATGPVFVRDYGETVSEQNLYLLAQKYPEKNYFPGYTQKKDFLRSLNNTIISVILEKKTPHLLIARAISDSLSQKHLLFAFDNIFQTIFTVNGWSSSLWDERIVSQSSINDFLGISEADLGTNRVGYIIGRQVFQKIIIKDNGGVEEELTIVFKNEKIFPQGENYKNYLRIALPENVSLLEISIDNKLQEVVNAVIDPLTYEAKDFKTSQVLEVENTQEKGKAVFGFLLNIPAGNSTTIKMKYALPGIALGQNTFSYNLKLFKQPGTDRLPYSLDLTYPNSFSPINSPNKIKKTEQQVSFSEKIINDINLVINFSPK